MTERVLTYPKFEDIPVSTKTFIVRTNITVDIKNLFEFLPITEYVLVPKRRGRKKKLPASDPNKNIPDGSIITLDLANVIRGVVLKKKKKKDNKTSGYFRNSITVVMVIEGKKINFKISRNGKFQMTGCKQDKHAELCVKYIWEYIKDRPNLYVMTEPQLKAMFIPAMRNIDFTLGFVLDREKLGKYFDSHTDYCSLLETSIGYTGVNIKVPVRKSIESLKLKELTYRNGTWQEPAFIPYQEYLNTLKPKEQQKKLDKERFNTFLVFHSGKTIMSSMCEEFAKDTYYEFLNIIKNNYNQFEEKLKSESTDNLTTNSSDSVSIKTSNEQRYKTTMCSVIQF